MRFGSEPALAAARAEQPAAVQMSKARVWAGSRRFGSGQGSTLLAMDDAERLRMVDARIAILEALVLVSEPGRARRLVDVTQASADQAELYLRIADEWGLTEVQAAALADVQFRLLTKERRLQLLEELEAKKAERDRLCSAF